ncbi:MAG: copper amine oxidase N-terminal domain-containing protein [Defluviitaleaceae bacterium]|nr:copper amine oxidase N-terminal domain-containing protein [Defluviitaleaceae bacterium]
MKNILKNNKIIKNIFKTVVVAGISLVMSASAVQIIHADADNFANGIVTRNAPSRRGAVGLTISGQLPRAITGNRNLDEALNDRFMGQFNEFVDEHMGRAAIMEFSKDVMVSGDFVSVIIDMTATSATTTSAIATTVINTETGEIITLSDYSPNMLPLINDQLMSIVASSPRLFVSDFSGIDNGHPFYFDGDVLVIPFASGTFSSANRDVSLQSFSRTLIQNEVVGSHMFTTLDGDQYNTIMVRLVDVVGLFGFNTTWDGDAQTVTIYHSGELATKVVVGENSHGLELAPEIINNRVHVPLSFFREVLGIIATVNSDGVILMTMYQSFE